MEILSRSGHSLVMKSLTTPLLAIVTAAVVVGMVTIGMQQAYAPRNCPDCGEFKKLTHEFEKSVIGLIGNPDEGPIPHLRELLDAYDEKVVQLFFTDPWLDQVRTLLQSYTDDVTTIFDQQPPDPDKQLVQDFRALTHDFVKAVIGASNPPEPE